jgi:hypothetical protein
MRAMHSGSTSVRAFSRSAFRRVSWIVIALMALNSLWPLIAGARPAGAAMMEICTAQGLRLVAGDPAAPQNGDAKDPISHCTLCSGPDKPAVPPAVFAQLAFASIQLLRPVQTPSFVAPNGYSRSPAHPRAPPVLS